MTYHQLWTDGSADGLLRVGGYAALVVGETSTLVSGNTTNTTSNQMELYAVLVGLAEVPEGVTVRIYTDSTNVIQWLKGEKPISNTAIRQMVNQISREAKRRNLTLVMKKVPAHRHIPGNVKCDKASRKALKDARNREFYHRKEQV